MDTLLQDVRHAARSLFRSPGFSLTAILTLALGIGASTAIFSVVRAVLLKPLPYAEPGRLVVVWSDLRKRNLFDFPLPPGDFADMRRDVTQFEGLAGVVTFRQAVSGNDVPPERVVAAAATPNLFKVLGLRVTLGRDFVEEDGTPQAPPPAGPPAPGAAPPPRLPGSAILSHEFWQRHFGGDRSIVGKSFTVGNNQAQVVGVLEPGAELLFPPGTNTERRPAFWIALRQNFADTSIGSRINVFMRVIGRLKPGVSVAQLQSRLDVLAADLRQRFPIKETSGMYFRAESMAQDLVADVETPVLALMGAVVFVLLIACANVANLLLVRAAGRGHELAVRAALGGSRGRLVRQLLTESLVLAGLGAALGLVLARLGISLLLAIGPEDLPRLDTVGIDPLVLGFAVVATAVAALVFGIAPALRASEANAADALRSGARSVGARGGRLSSGVVIAEVALSFVLLIGSGLMVRSFIALTRTDPGYRPSGLLTFFVSNFRGANTPELRSARARELRDRLSAVPGVKAVTAAGPFPLDGRIQNARYWTEAAQTDPTLFQQADVHIVQPGYFEALGTPLLEGRTFTEADNRDSAKVVVIDKLVAAKAFPHQSAVGQRLFARFRGNDPEFVDIIGVVAHQRHASLTTEGREAVFFTDGQFGFGGADRWAVRTDGDPSRLGPSVRAAIQAFDPLLIVSELQPMSAYVDKAEAQTRFALICIAVFAGIAVLLAAVGLYGVLATLVRQRTSEIGVRLAFGAEPGGILRLVVGQGLRLSAVGLLLGLLAAFGLTRVMTHMLVGVTPTDPATFGAIAVLFLAIVTFASWLPARRAARVDPMVALRSE